MVQFLPSKRERTRLGIFHRVRIVSSWDCSDRIVGVPAVCSRDSPHSSRIISGRGRPRKMTPTRIKAHGQKCFRCQIELPIRTEVMRNSPAHTAKYYCLDCVIILENPRGVRDGGDPLPATF